MAEWALANAYGDQEKGFGASSSLASAFETLNALRLMLCATRFMSCAADAMADLLLAVCSRFVRFGGCDGYLADPPLFVQEVLMETRATLEEAESLGAAGATEFRPVLLPSSFVPIGHCDIEAFPELDAQQQIRSLRLHHFDRVPFVSVDPFQVAVSVNWRIIRALLFGVYIRALMLETPRSCTACAGLVPPPRGGWSIWAQATGPATRTWRTWPTAS